MSSRRPRPLPPQAKSVVSALAPFVVCLMIAGWVLWGRADPARQGGYCANATVVIGDSLRRSDTPTAAGRGPLPDIGALLGTAGSVDVTRLQVSTPRSLRADVAVLAARVPESVPPDARVTAAYARVAADYLDRCRGEAAADG